MEGYVKLYRKFLEWQWYSEPTTKAVFIHCLLKANYENCIWNGTAINRGSFITTNERLSTELWLSVSKVRQAIRNLVKTGEITISATNKFTLITITKWNEYQLPEKKIIEPKIPLKVKKRTDESLEWEIERKERFGGHYYNVKKRDLYKCAICGTRDDLIVHHIIPYDPDNDDTVLKNNLITLCKSCHEKIHKKSKVKGFPDLLGDETLDRIGFGSEMKSKYNVLLKDFQGGD